MTAGRIRNLLTLSAACLLPLASGEAPASGFALLEQSASRLGAAFAGTAAAADDATTNYFNPAGLARLDRMELAVVVSAIDITSEFSNTASTPALGHPLGGNGGDAGDWNFVPTAYFAAPITDELAFGIGVNVPFGLKLEYEADWIGRFQALNSEIETINVNPTLAYAVNERFSIGVGVSYQRVDAELTNALNYSAVVAQGVQQLVAAGQIPAVAAPGIIAANAGLEGGVRVSGDDDAWGFNVGVLFDVGERARIGLHYRSSIDYSVRGSIQFTAPPVSQPIGAAIVAQASAPGGPLASGPAFVDLELPESAILSVRHQTTDRLVLLADIAWTAWSSVPELRFQRDTGEVISVTPELWEDVWRYALGAAYTLNERWTLRVGAAYDETPVPGATRTPRLPDPNRTWLAVGARFTPSPSVMIDVGYAHLFSDDVGLNQDDGNPLAAGGIVGEQSSDIDILAAQLVYRF